MARQEILNRIMQMFGSVPGWLGGLPNAQLEHQRDLVTWLQGEGSV